MSTRMDTELRLGGHGGPFFPPQIRAINAINCFAPFGWNGNELMKWAARIPGYMQDESRGHTEDWFWAMAFKLGDALVHICFPDATEWRKREDGTSQARHVALYVQSAVAPDALESFLEEALRQAYLHAAENKASDMIYEALQTAINEPDPAKAAAERIASTFHAQYTVVEKATAEGNSMSLWGAITVIIDNKPVKIEAAHSRTAH